MICSINLKEDDNKILEEYMKQNKIKSKSFAISECIKKACSNESIDDFVFEINSKLNRLVHNQFLTKKLVEQLFANYHFRENLEIENDEKLNDFYRKVNSYKNKFLG